MIPFITVALATGTFFINAENRHFMHKWIYLPTAHTTVKVERVIVHPFHRKRKP